MSKQLIERIQDYSEGRIGITDDPEVYQVVMNLPIVRELQRRDNQFRGEAQDMREAMRFLQSSGDSFCVMWDNFKEAVKETDDNTVNS